MLPVPQELAFANYVLRVHERQLLREGLPVTLGARAFDILCVLVEHAGELVTKAQLFERVWSGMVVEENNLQVHISTLRKTLGGDFIATVAGRGYRFAANIDKVGRAPASAPANISTTDRSIAVLPFVNLSQDPEQEYFSDGLAEDIITKLTRSSWLFVIARNSSFGYRQTGTAAATTVCQELGTRYLVMGTVRRSGAVLRVTAELVDGLQNEILWSQRFDRPLEDLFAVQEQISAAIVSAIEPVYLRREETRTSQDKAPQIEHWELLMRARWHFWRSTKEHMEAARVCLHKSLEAKPDDPSSLALLAFTHMTRIWAGWTLQPKEEILEANRLALRAVRLDDTDSYAHFTLGTALSFTGNLPQAIAEQEYALTLYPQFAAAAGELGRLLAFSGRTQEAMEYVLQATDASPHDPHLSLWMRSRGLASFVDGDYASAAKYASQATAMRPDWFFNYYLLASSQAAQGQIADAEKTLAQAKTYGHYTLQAMCFGHPFVDDEVFNTFVDNLRKAGWDD